MKKWVILVCMLLVISTPLASAAVDSIYEYLQQVNKNYPIVLGANAKGADSLAAIDVATGIKKYNPNKPDLEAVVETEVQPHQVKILIGHPCQNSLVPFSCTSWPYKKGEAVITIVGNDLVIAGSTPDDTRKAAKLISSYPSYPLFKQTKNVILTTNNKGVLNITTAKTESELVCGDGICEVGEQLCYADCAKVTCFDICNEEGYGEASCRDEKSNPNVKSCETEEFNKGTGYCATGKVCCCKKSLEQINGEKKQETENSTSSDQKKESISLWQRILRFFKHLFHLE